MQKQNLISKNKIEEPHDFRLYLQSELVQRCQKNPSYSLRAFAKMLKTSPSALSAMLNNKRPITASMRQRFCAALSLGPGEMAKFDAATEPARQKAASAWRDYQQLNADTFAVISDWYHYGILELTRVTGFEPDTKWVAKALGISRSEANIAVERLQRVGLLAIDKKGHWCDTSADGNATNIDERYSAAGARKLQKQMLEMSLAALEQVAIEKRSHTSMTLAMNPADMPEAKEMIKNFRRDLTKFLEKNKTPTQVYHLAVSLYPVTKI